MSRIFDALQHAKREKEIPPAESVSPPSTSLPQPTTAEVEMEEEMISLYQTITSSLPDVKHPSVLFIGSRSNEGTSTVARQLARTASLRIGKNVLLIDLDRSRPDLHVYANMQLQGEIDEVVCTGSAIDKAFRQVEDSSLYVMPLFQSTMVTPRTLDYARSGLFWESLQNRFDLIIVDAPPATRFPDGLGMVSSVDGVVLVVEAEKTRWPVALNVKQKVLANGGKVIGIVFNKRRYYIPRWLYKRL